MNKKFAAVALGTLLSVGVGAAQAGELTEDQVPWNQQPVASSVTRAQVQAELRQFQNDTHEVVYAVYPDDRAANVAAPASGKTRAEVKQEIDFARSNQAPGTSPDSPYFG
ncbi:MAG: DUF4148 domain-containing protein [Burkholderiaceae bacterium]